SRALGCRVVACTGCVVSHRTADTPIAAALHSEWRTVLRSLRTYPDAAAIRLDPEGWRMASGTAASRRGVHVPSALSASTPQRSGGCTLPAACACMSAGSSRPASHAATAVMSDSLRRHGGAGVRAPGAELGADVVVRQADQAGDVGLHAGELAAVAALAGGNAARGVARAHQLLATLQCRGGYRGPRRARVRHLLRREVLGDLPQVGRIE